MKKFILLLFLFFIGCNYKPNYQINKRKPPVVVIAIDTTIDAVVFRDGDNKVFTIYDNATTKAITETLSVGDTLREEQMTVISNNF